MTDAPILRIENVHFAYAAENTGQNTAPDTPPVQALRGVSLTVQPGEYVAILGHNGSGKSTLARLLNGLLLPTQGDVWVREWNTRDSAHVREIRSTVGMVFQTPDNQIVATIVEEDVAFGPENLGVPRAEMVRRVEEALAQVDMLEHRLRAPHMLSGGQKQRVCIAGVLAMRPQVLVLDEATAMLDPQGRKEVLATVRRLHREQGTTVIAITHFMHEALEAQRIVVLAEGQVALEGSPRQIFTQVDTLRELQLDAPPVSAIARRLHERDATFPADALTVEELASAVAARVADINLPRNNLPGSSETSGKVNPIISVRGLAHTYMRGTPLEVRALENVDLELRPGEIVGIIGHTGSGKSTAIQFLNGLLRPQVGSVVIFGDEMADPKLDARRVRAARRRVGLVFQFPEAQLFERYVGDDVAYGPRNLGLDRAQVRERVRRAMEAVGLGFEEYKDRLTFGLSGGQRRRVALAGVLALEPEALILDEPTAGLDPHGRRLLLDHLLALHKQGISLALVSHNMEELAEVCDRIYVIAEGRTVMSGPPGATFARIAELRELGLDAPAPAAVMEALVARGVLASLPEVYTEDQAVALLEKVLAKTEPSG